MFTWLHSPTHHRSFFFLLSNTTLFTFSHICFFSPALLSQKYSSTLWSVAAAAHRITELSRLQLPDGKDQLFSGHSKWIFFKNKDFLVFLFFQEWKHVENPVRGWPAPPADPLPRNKNTLNIFKSVCVSPCLYHTGFLLWRFLQLSRGRMYNKLYLPHPEDLTLQPSHWFSSNTLSSVRVTKPVLLSVILLWKTQQA